MKITIINSAYYDVFNCITKTKQFSVVKNGQSLKKNK